MRKTITLVAGLAATTLLCGVYFSLGKRSDAPIDDSQSGARSIEGRAPASLKAPVFLGGGDRAYRFTRALKATMGSRELIDLRLAGLLLVKGKGATMIVRISGAETPREPLRDLPAVKIAKDGERMLFSTQDARRGEASDALRAASIRFARDLVDQYEFFSEVDLQGKYEARITPLDGRRYQKSKTKYLDGPYASARISQSRHVLETDGASDPGIVTIQGDEAIVLGEADMAILNRSSYRITQAIDQEAELLALDGGVWSAKRGLPGAEDMVEGGSSDGFASADGLPGLSELLAELLSGKVSAGQERLALFRRLVERLNAEAGKLDVAREAWKALRDHPDDLRLLVGALASSSQGDAATMLVEAYRDKASTPDERALIMSAWTASDTPLPSEGTDLLMKLASDGGRGPQDEAEARDAMLALGAQAGKTLSLDGKGRIQSFLVAKLKGARDDAEIMAALDAMGNSGEEVFLPHIRERLVGPSEQVRARAYMALRLMPGDSIMALLDAGKSDPSKAVQDSISLSRQLRESAL